MVKYRRKAKSGKTIEVIVRGETEDKFEATVALIQNAEYAEIKDIISELTMDKVLHLAQACHGKMYREIRGY